MVWFVSLLLSVARAQCPDAGPSLDAAERDVVSFFLVEAEAALATAAEGFGCAASDPATFARYWRLQAMIWHLQENPRRDRALSAARRDAPDTWDEALGTELRGLWEVTDPVRGGVVALNVRGTRRGDVVLLDGLVLQGQEAAEGLHVLQVRRGEQIVFARVVDLLGPDGLEIAVTAGGPSVEALSWTAPWPGPPTWTALSIRDASGQRLRLGRDIVPVALQTEAGRELWPKYRRNARLQRWAVGSAVLGFYGSYLYTAEFTRGGSNIGRTAARNGVTFSLLALGTALTWEGVLVTKRARLRRGMLEAASTLAESP
jgi:hypothetical protein